jgi:hypothetical protein
LAPIVGALIVAIGTPAVLTVLLRRRSRRGRAIERLATEAAHEQSTYRGYPDESDGWFDYFTGRSKEADVLNRHPKTR